MFAAAEVKASLVFFLLLLEFRLPLKNDDATPLGKRVKSHLGIEDRNAKKGRRPQKGSDEHGE